MVRYLNPGGHNWSAENLDGYGISQIVVAVVYTIFLSAACAYLWFHRQHPIMKIRKVGLTLFSVLVLHVYVFMVFLVYPLNGAFPCGVEFWIMSTYLPLGIGLFQAQNRQLLLVSRGQNQLLRNEEIHRPLYSRRGRGAGGSRHWLWRFKLWLQETSTRNMYEGFVVIGMIVQFSVTLTLFCISRKFNRYGIVSHATTPGLCRRGWEWVPSIAWQALWNFILGPYLLWKIRMIRDIYHWRLQTTLAIVAGIPGTPLWLAGVYINSFSSVNKYWVPAMWLVPGLIMMELVTLIFPIVAVFKHQRTARKLKRALDTFGTKQKSKSSTSTVTRSSGSKRSGIMYSTESLDECLTGSYNALQNYASCVEFNGENIMFLVKVLAFRNIWRTAMSSTTSISRTRKLLFRAALNIFISLVHSQTAAYPINIESTVYTKLNAIFGAATALVASTNEFRKPSTSSSTPSKSAVAPWEEPDHTPTISASSSNESGFQLHAMPPRRPSTSHDSSERILPAVDTDVLLADFCVPPEFNEKVFDDAYQSVRHMVWSETWQRFMQWKTNSGSSA